MTTKAISFSIKDEDYYGAKASLLIDPEDRTVSVWDHNGHPLVVHHNRQVMVGLPPNCRGETLRYWLEQDMERLEEIMGLYLDAEFDGSNLRGRWDSRVAAVLLSLDEDLAQIALDDEGFCWSDADSVFDYGTELAEVKKAVAKNPNVLARVLALGSDTGDWHVRQRDIEDYYQGLLDTVIEELLAAGELNWWMVCSVDDGVCETYLAADEGAAEEYAEEWIREGDYSGAIKPVVEARIAYRHLSSKDEDPDISDGEWTHLDVEIEIDPEVVEYNRRA